MPIELEQVSGSEPMDRVARLPSLAFGIPLDKTALWFEEKVRRENLRVVRLDDEPVGCVARIPMGMYLGGAPVPQIGIAGVAIAPEQRGNGLGGQMMAQTVREMHEERVPFSTLYSALHPLYRGAGYEDAGLLSEATIPAGLIRVPKGDGSREQTSGSGWREVDDAMMPSVHACYASYASHQTGMLDRGGYIWDRVRAPGGEPAQGFAAIDERGGVEAYVFYTTERFNAREAGTGSAAGQKMMISDHAWSTPAGLNRLLAFLRGYSSIVGEMTTCIVASSPLLMALPDRRIACRVRERWMLRVTHLVAALEARGYTKHVSGAMGLRVEDPTIAGNAGDWLLRVEAGKGACTRATDLSGTPTLTLDINALAPLYTGHMTARVLREAGRLGGPPEALELAEAFFATGTPPAMVDMF